MEESQFFYSAELEILDPLRCKAANMKINFQPDMHATEVTIDFDEVERWVYGSDKTGIR